MIGGPSVIAIGGAAAGVYPLDRAAPGELAQEPVDGDERSSGLEPRALDDLEFTYRPALRNTCAASL